MRRSWRAGLVVLACSVATGCARRAEAPSLAAASPTTDMPVAATPAPTLALPERLGGGVPGVHPTIDTVEQARVSVPLDVDTTPWLRARAALDRGEWPEQADIAVAAFVNAFTYDDPAPTDDDAFAITTELLPAPHLPKEHLLRVAIRARAIVPGDRERVTAVIVVDASSSMGRAGRLSLVRAALQGLGERLRADDRIAVVAAGDGAELVLPPTPGDRRDALAAALVAIAPEGSDDLPGALAAAYMLVDRAPPSDAVFRVIVCSDGAADPGDDAELLAQVTEQAAHGVTTATIGIGTTDDLLLARIGEEGLGGSSWVDRREEAVRALVERTTGEPQLVARDAELEIELDPSAVAHHRPLATASTRSIGGDVLAPGGVDLGADHRETALFEVQLAQPDVASLGTVRLRWVEPYTGRARAIARPIAPARRRDEHSDLAVVAALLAEKLAHGRTVATLEWDALLRQWDALPDLVRDRPDVVELRTAIEQAAAIAAGPRRPLPSDPLAALARIPVLR